MHNTLIFYAPLGKGVPLEHCGGAESGCHKTLDTYQRKGIDVKVLHKPAKSQGIINYFCGLLTVPFRLIILLLKNNSAPVHLVGFYRNIVFFEYLLMQICRIFNHKVIYEPRNGSLVSSYQKGGAWYRFLLKSLLTKPDVVLCQGLEYVHFIEKEWGIKRTYFPNFIPDSFVRPNNLQRRRNPLRLIYFGRVTPSKRVDIIIETAGVLKEHGMDVKLDIIGGYAEDYHQFLQGIVKDRGIQDNVVFHGRKDFSFIVEKLQEAHYFIFPSDEEQEGHSNSLTEAMGCGVVPIVSNAGFNASICGNNSLVVGEYDSRAYAGKVMQIESNGEWEKLSECVYNRVVENYTQKVVGKVLIETIAELFEQ